MWSGTTAKVEQPYHAEAPGALKDAKVVDKCSKKYDAKVGRGQMSLKDFSLPLPEAQSESDLYSQLIEAQKKTTNFPKFPLSLLQPLYNWLKTVEGKERTDTTAKEICVDVSKCLRYHHHQFSWDYLLDCSKTRDYLEVCKKAGVQADGLVTKCDRILTCLQFMKFDMTGAGDTVKRAAIDAAMERITTWKKHWRKEKGKARELEMVSMSVEVPDVCKATEIIRLAEVWETFDSIVEAISRKVPVTDDDLKTATASIAAALLFQSVQRPGAVAGLTLSEYAAGNYYRDDGVWVFMVKQHKTSSKGPATLTSEDFFKDKLDQYVRFVRGVCDPSDVSPYVLALPSGAPVKDLGKLLKRLEVKFGTKVPSATSLRKKVATVAAKKCTPKERDVISRQMSHSMSTHIKYYEQVGTSAGAVDAFRVQKKLIYGTEKGTKGRQRFTTTEEKKIKTHFKEHISTGKNASLTECRAYLASVDNAFGRSDKQIQDKVKSLISKEQ